jgi:20S proteasome subunit beta 7
MFPIPTSHSKALGPGVTGPELLVPSSYVAVRPPAHVDHQPTCGAQSFALDAMLPGDPIQHTKQPYVTGTSILGVKYCDGVLMAADTLGSYGSTKRYKSLERIKQVNSSCAVAASGEYSDFQQIMTYLDELTTDDYRMDDGIQLGPKQIYAYLCRVMYNRRNKFDPLWNNIIVSGVQDGEPFLGLVTMNGTHYSDSHITTGFANGLARPLMRERQRDDMTLEEATTLLHDCLRVLYYRDKQSINKYQVSNVTKDGVTISEPFALDSKWDYKIFANPTKWATGAW